MRPKRKLNEDQVRDIRSSTMSQARMAAKYDVDRKTVRNIRQGRTYHDVPDQPPSSPDFDPTLHGKYHVGDPLEFLAKLPVGCAETVLTASPPHRPALVGGLKRGRHSLHQRSIIEESLRVVGPAGVVMYVHRPQFGDDGALDVGAAIFRNLPLRQVIVWVCPMIYEPRHSERRPANGLRMVQNYANILLFAREDWQVPLDTANQFARWGAAWVFRRPHSGNAPPEFPLELAQRCIALGQGPVLDPCAGTGTTAVAAKAADRQWIMFDEVDDCREIFEWRMAGLGEQDPALRRVSRRD